MLPVTNYVCIVFVMNSSMNAYIFTNMGITVPKSTSIYLLSFVHCKTPENFPKHIRLENTYHLRMSNDIDGPIALRDDPWSPGQFPCPRIPRGGGSTTPWNIGTNGHIGPREGASKALDKTVPKIIRFQDWVQLSGQGKVKYRVYEFKNLTFITYLRKRSIK